MQEKYPDTSGLPAMEGEASHWIASEVLQGRGADPFINRFAPNGVIITQEMIDAAMVYVESIFKTVKLTTRVGHVEEPISIDRIHPQCGGTPDWWWLDETTNTLYVYDYKYGFSPVECWNNWQLICYVIGVMDKITKGNGLADQRLNVVMRIVQPRSFHASGPVREWPVCGSDLRAQANQLRESANEALGHNPHVKSGSHCRYCSARHACPAAQTAAMFSVDYSYQAVTQELSPKAAGIEYRTLQRAMELIKSRMTGIEEQILKLCREGHGVETGLTIGYTGGKLVWDKTDDEVIAMGDMFGMDLRAPQQALTPTQVKNTRKDFPETLMKDFTKRTIGTEKLVPADKTLAAQVFGK